MLVLAVVVMVPVCRHALAVRCSLVVRVLSISVMRVMTNEQTNKKRKKKEGSTLRNVCPFSILLRFVVSKCITNIVLAQLFSTISSPNLTIPMTDVMTAALSVCHAVVEEQVTFESEAYSTVNNACFQQHDTNISAESEASSSGDEVTMDDSLRPTSYFECDVAGASTGLSNEPGATGPHRRRKARRAPRRKNNKPYSAMTWEERKELEERDAETAEREARRLAKLKDRGHGRGLVREQPPPAPVITTQFIVAHRISPDNVHTFELPDPPVDESVADAPLDNPAESNQSDFLEAYKEAMFDNLSREELIERLQAQDDEMQKLRQAMRQMQQQQPQLSTSPTK